MKHSSRSFQDLATRAGWTVADQILSSLQNALLSVLVARAVSRSSFGAFGIAFAAFSLTVELSGAVGGQVLEVLFAPLRPLRSAAARAGVGASLIVGTIIGLITLVAAPFCRGELLCVLCVLGLSLPGLAIQDAWRTTSICSNQPKKGFFNDLLFLILEVLGILLLIMLHNRSAAMYVFVWGISATLAATYGLFQFQCVPSIRDGKQFLHDHKSVSLPGFLTAFLILGAIQVSLLAIGLVANLDSVGALRGAQTLLGPMNIIGFAGAAFLVPELASRPLPTRKCRQAAASFSGVLLLVNVLWGSLLLVLPESAGVALLGDSWVSVRRALPLMLLSNCLVTLATGPSAVIRALNRNRYLTYLGLLGAPLFVTLPALGARRYGPAGATGGFALTAALLAGPAWIFLNKAAVQGRRRSSEETVSGRFPELTELA